LGKGFFFLVLLEFINKVIIFSPKHGLDLVVLNYEKKWLDYDPILGLSIRINITSILTKT